MKPTNKKLKGFGLIETLIACAILIIITGAVLAVNVIITNDITFTKQRSAAYNLASEAVEGVRNIRDTNLIDSYSVTDWDTFICNSSVSPSLLRPSLSNDTTNVYYRLSAGIIEACYPGTTRVALVPDTSTDGEAITVGETKFYRKISFISSGLDDAIPAVSSDADKIAANALRVKVNISWVDNGRDRTIEIRELLTNWKQGF